MLKIGKDDVILFFILSYLLIFGFLSLIKDNTEFVYYSVVFLACFFVLHGLHKRVRFPMFLLVSIAIYGLLHFIGGLFFFRTVRIYDLRFMILEYDNIVHTLAAFILTVFGYSILEPGLNDMIKKNRLYFGILLGLFGFGIASFGEIVEFAGVKFLGATGVGDYFNNAWDLVFNFIGVSIGSFLVVRHHWQKDIIKVKDGKRLKFLNT